MDMIFERCQSCRELPGSSTFCSSCLHNQAVIGELVAKLQRSELGSDTKKVVVIGLVLVAGFFGVLVGFTAGFLMMAQVIAK